MTKTQVSPKGLASVYEHNLKTARRKQEQAGTSPALPPPALGDHKRQVPNSPALHAVMILSQTHGFEDMNAFEFVGAMLAIMKVPEDQHSEWVNDLTGMFCALRRRLEV